MSRNTFKQNMKAEEWHRYQQITKVSRCRSVLSQVIMNVKFVDNKPMALIFYNLLFNLVSAASTVIALLSTNAPYLNI